MEKLATSSVLPKSYLKIYIKTVNSKHEVSQKIKEAKKTNEKMRYFCHHTCPNGLFDINARHLGILKR